MIGEKTMSMVELQVNGNLSRTVVRNADTLLDVLREQLGERSRQAFKLE